jgi:hypothetical protein
MRCPSCDHDNRAERRFCAECGTVLKAVCALCGASNQPGEKFCGGCGERLPTLAPAPGNSAQACAIAGGLPRPFAGASQRGTCKAEWMQDSSGGLLYRCYGEASVWCR